MRAPPGGPLPTPMSGGYLCCIQVSSLCYWCRLVRIINKRIHEDLVVLLFADHIRALTARYDLKLADVENPLVGNSADTYADRGSTPSPEAWAKGSRSQQSIRGHRPRWPSRPNESRSALISRVLFDYPVLGFPWFSWAARQMPASTMLSPGTARTSLSRSGGFT